MDYEVLNGMTEFMHSDWCRVTEDGRFEFINDDSPLTYTYTAEELEAFFTERSKKLDDLVLWLRQPSEANPVDEGTVDLFGLSEDDIWQMVSSAIIGESEPSPKPAEVTISLKLPTMSVSVTIDGDLADIVNLSEQVSEMLETG